MLQKAKTKVFGRAFYKKLADFKDGVFGHRVRESGLNRFPHPQTFSSIDNGSKKAYLGLKDSIFDSI